MRYFLTILCLVSVAYGHINVRNLGAVGNGVADDWAAIQKALDSAAKTSGIVYVPPGKYRISKPLMIYNWAGKQYTTVTVKLYGDDNMWSRGTMIAVIKPDFKDGFALGIQQGKGVIVEGISFQGQYQPPAMSQDSMYRLSLEAYGDFTVRRDRYSPYAAVVIDPFSGTPPQGGGYPKMSSWYRGPQTRSGSTGCRFKDMTFWGFDVGAVTSPNGFTQNAELITFENIRVTNCRIGFGTSQAQEKMNRIINVGAWGVTHTLFASPYFGFGQPGHWIIDGVNTAGQVANLVHRASNGFFPLHVYNVFAESLGSIGYWQSGVGDGMHNSIINFIYPDQVKAYHSSFSQVLGITFNNCHIRYYGQLTTPVVFGANSSDLKFVNSVFYVPPVWGKLPAQTDSVDMGDYMLFRGGFKTAYFREGNNIKVRIPMKKYPDMAVGDAVVIVNGSNWKIVGAAKVAQVGKDFFVVDYISAHLDQSVPYAFYIYRSKRSGDPVNTKQDEPGKRKQQVFVK
jgi:hypothetical protein